MQKKLEQEMILSALKARSAAYAPYSNFTVGAALLTVDGKIFTGCNIECATYSPTVCAERVALLKAVSNGERKFSAIAVACGKNGETPQDYCSPCGVCRQFLYEFYSPDFIVYMVKSKDDFIKKSLDELLPLAFGPSSLE